MRTFRWAIGLILAGGLAVIVSMAAGPFSPQQPQVYVPGQLLVKFKAAVPTVLKTATLAHSNSRVLSRISGLDIYVIQIPDDAAVEETIDAFNGNPNVEYAQPNYIYRAAITPNDKYFEYQYGLFNRGQDIEWVPGGPQGKPSADIKAPSAWEETVGTKDVIIGILDTGVDFTHPDLKNKVVDPGRDFVNDDFEAMDDNFHGTMVAGIAAAETNNDEGIAGVAWNCKILPVKVLDKDGFGTEDKIIQGILWAVDHGAKILNLSFGSTATGPALRDALKSVFETKDVFIAAAAGNSNTTVEYPAAYENYVCAVAATDYNDQRAFYSNFGPEIDVAAPGEKILSTVPVALITPRTPFPYGYDSGTSLSCAFVSGLAGLIKSLKPSLTPSQIMNIIRYSADDVNASTYKGKDDFLGYGRINMEKALVPLKITK